MENFFNFLTTLLKSALGLFLAVVVAGILWASKQADIKNEKSRAEHEQQRIEFVRKVQSGDIDKSVLVCDFNTKEWDYERKQYVTGNEIRYLKFFTQDSFMAGSLEKVRSAKKAGYQYNTMKVYDDYSAQYVEYTEVNISGNQIEKFSILHTQGKQPVISVSVKENGYDVYMQSLSNCKRAY